MFKINIVRDNRKSITHQMNHINQVYKVICKFKTGGQFLRRIFIMVSVGDWIDMSIVEKKKNNKNRKY